MSSRIIKSILTKGLKLLNCGVDYNSKLNSQFSHHLTFNTEFRNNNLLYPESEYKYPKLSDQIGVLGQKLCN
mgnify:CR=1 FL=1